MIDNKTEEVSMDYQEYLEASREIFSKIFGEESLSQLDKTPKTPIEWNGLEVTDISVLSVQHNVKNRFTKSNLESEKDNCMFNMFISTVFHYGYQVGRATQKDQINYLNRSLEDYKEMYKMYKEEVIKLKSGGSE